MLLIKAAYLKISLSPDENAGRGDGGQFLSQYCAREVTVIVAWQTFVRMGGDTFVHSVEEALSISIGVFPDLARIRPSNATPSARETKA